MMYHIRPATLQDLPTLTEFGLALAYESENLSLNAERISKGIAAVLDDPHKGEYFLLEEHGQILAQLLLTYEWSDWNAAWYWWIQSVYVRPTSRGKGCYKALYQTVLDRARTENVRAIRLYVARNNHAAQAAYRKLGMTPAHYELYETDLMS